MTLVKILLITLLCLQVLQAAQLDKRASSRTSNVCCTRCFENRRDSYLVGKEFQNFRSSASSVIRMNMEMNYAERLFSSLPSNFTYYMISRLTDIAQRQDHNLSKMTIDSTKDSRVSYGQANGQLLLASLIAIRKVVARNKIGQDDQFVNTMVNVLKEVERSFLEWQTSSYYQKSILGINEKSKIALMMVIQSVLMSMGPDEQTEVKTELQSVKTDLQSVNEQCSELRDMDYRVICTTPETSAWRRIDIFKIFRGWKAPPFTQATPAKRFLYKLRRYSTIRKDQNIDMNDVGYGFKRLPRDHEETPDDINWERTIETIFYASSSLDPAFNDPDVLQLLFRLRFDGQVPGLTDDGSAAYKAKVNSVWSYIVSIIYSPFFYNMYGKSFLLALESSCPETCVATC